MNWLKTQRSKPHITSGISCGTPRDNVGAIVVGLMLAAAAAVTRVVVVTAAAVGKVLAAPAVAESGHTANLLELVASFAGLG